MNWIELLKKGFVIPGMIIALLAMTMLPLPPILLDLLFTFNIFFSLLILLVAIYTLRPLEFAAFPSILLVATLLRLALNIASTRVVLINGHTGPHAAGQVIESFGNVVIGGNYAVGFVVFAILVIINFVVITKGATRISEVSARFTLDALPGKQMAIDADLNAGLISQEESKKRRDLVAQEADFYGSMDGASKFVRGDAVAGLLILFINLIGGFFIGMIQHGLSMGDALQIYGLLTIGDGLVAQIPSLLLSTAAAIMVTRESKEHDIGEMVAHQLFYGKQPVFVASIIMIILGLIPGMPHLAFIGVAVSILMWMRFSTDKRFDNLQQLEKKEGGALALADQSNMITAIDPSQEKNQEVLPEEQLNWKDVQNNHDIIVEIGFKLVSLARVENGGDLLAKLKGVRRKISADFGFLIPSIHIKDNLSLGSSSYQIIIKGIVEGKGELFPDLILAINPGEVDEEMQGRKIIEPSFGMEAVWVKPDQKETAQLFGYTVVDPATVLATHLSYLLMEQLHAVLGYDEVQKLIDLTAEKTPKLIDDLIPKKYSTSALMKVLQNLLMDKIPIKEFRHILEGLLFYQGQDTDPVLLTEHIRQHLSKLIIQQVDAEKLDQIPVMTLSQNLENILQKSIKPASYLPSIEPSLLQKLKAKIKDFVDNQENKGEPAILLVPPSLRAGLAHIIRYAVSGISILSYAEIPMNKNVQIISQLGD